MAKPLFRDREAVARAIGELAFSNPFLPERIELEKAALGERYSGETVVWSVDPTRPDEHPNVVALSEIAEELVEAARRRLTKRRTAGRRVAEPGERRIYEDLVLYVLYYRVEDDLFAEAVADEPRPIDCYERFAADLAYFFEPFGGIDASPDAPEHLFALFFQYRRAFHFIFRHILGASLPAAELRAAAWQSAFTHDVERYRRHLYGRMHELTTLILGPSGTGKELVARAIGLSRYIPFDAASRRFVVGHRESFVPINLAALTVTLIESELFGHKKGAFTGAVADRRGYLDRDEAWSTVFLDEIGEIDPGVQLKLLRVLQAREFQRLGENRTRRFGGKIIAATNRDLAAEMKAGHFREDLYYRLCSDVINMPSLAEQLRGDTEELRHLVYLLAERIVSTEEAASLTGEVVRAIEASLGADYDWPGNVRELEQCVRNVLVRRTYDPPDGKRAASARGPWAQLARQVERGELTAGELERRYATLIYLTEGSYEGAARRLELDRRTVKSRVDVAT